MNWRIKGVLQKLLSVAPGGVRINDLLQQTVGGLRNFESNVATKVSDWAILADHMTQLGMPLQGRRYLEIGTGWFPTLPVCFSLGGAEHCATFDLVHHLNPRLTTRMLTLLSSHLPAIADAAVQPRAAVEAAYTDLIGANSVPALLERARIDYHAPADAAATPLPPESVDVVFSNSVLEHVPPAVIRRLMEESRRILRPGGLSIHSANCGDHYAYFDSSITPINYLTYSERAWRFWDNRLLYQNRLRPIDFLDMAEQAGLEVVRAIYRPRPELFDALPRLAIAPEFQSYKPEQLCCTSVDFVARKR